MKLLSLSIFSLISAKLSTQTHVEFSLRRLDTETEWNYKKHGKDWMKLQIDENECSNTNRQSPIDIVDKNLENSSTKIATKYTTPSGARFFDNGKTVEAEFAGWNGGILRVENDTETVDYNLAQWHIHSPSEHTFNGQQRKVEIHLVHKTNINDVDKFSVIGLTFEPSSDTNPATSESIDTFFSFLDHELKQLHHHNDSDEESELEHGNIYSVIEKNIEYSNMGDLSIVMDIMSTETSDLYYHYQGSLTTPPCTEAVSWYVRKNAFYVTPEAWNELLETLSSIDNGKGNARVVQNKNNQNTVTIVQSIPFKDTKKANTVWGVIQSLLLEFGFYDEQSTIMGVSKRKFIWILSSTIGLVLFALIGLYIYYDTAHKNKYSYDSDEGETWKSKHMPLNTNDDDIYNLQYQR